MPVRALTGLVVLMGLMIVAGLGLLATKIAGRASHPVPRPGAATQSFAANRPFAAPPIDLPPGARVAAISTGADRVVVDVVLADGSQELVVIDLTTGHRLGTVPLRVPR